MEAVRPSTATMGNSTRRGAGLLPELHWHNNNPGPYIDSLSSCPGSSPGLNIESAPPDLNGGSGAMSGGFADFDAGHRDLVTVTKFNFYGNRIVTASSDHRMKVWDLKDGQWQLTDTWRAHDAEIRDATWNGPFTGQHIGSVGEDMKFKIWQEDVTQPPNSGRRFRTIFRMTAPQRHPFVSLDFRNIDLESWLALITRDGYLMVMEPVSPDSLADWQPLDQFRVCAAPERGEETSFRVQFHHDPTDITHTLLPESERKSLSLVVAAMDTVKVYRTDANRQFYHAIELNGHTGLVRDISWANGSVRGYDLIASGGKDGFVRIFEVYTTATNHGSQNASGRKSEARTQSPSIRSTTQSGIGTALANRAPKSTSNRRASGDSQFRHSCKLVACVDSKHLDVWQVEFSFAGDALISSGDDGIVRFWKKSLSGEWLEYAETDMASQ